VAGNWLSKAGSLDCGGLYLRHVNFLVRCNLFLVAQHPIRLQCGLPVVCYQQPQSQPLLTPGVPTCALAVREDDTTPLHWEVTSLDRERGWVRVTWEQVDQGYSAVGMLMVIDGGHPKEQAVFAHCLLSGHLQRLSCLLC
jgi:hypothetical protein